MSTKTTFKRVALVAVAALGLGVLSVAPSQADSISVTLTPSATTSAITTSETATITIAASAVAGATDDSLTVRAAVTSANVATAGTLGFVGTTDSTTTRINAPVASPASITLDSATVAIGQLIRGTVRLNLVTPSAAGTYSILVYTTTGGTSGASKGAADKEFTWTVTVTAPATAADSSSTSVIAAGSSSAHTTDAVVTAAKSDTGIVATIKVDQKNSTSSANEAMVVTLSGPGFISDNTADSTTAGNKVRSLSIAAPGAGNSRYIKVFADGTTGASTVTIVAATSGTVLGTETLTFSDTKPVSIAATVVKSFIRAGATTSDVFAVTLKDAAGNAITNAAATVTGTRSDTTTAGKAIATADLSCAWNTVGKAYHCSATGTSASGFGPAAYTITATGTDAAATKVSTTASTTFSDVVATKVTITGPATASVGDKITYTLTATDKNGYPIADTTYEGGSANGSVGGIFWNTTTVPDYSSSSVKPFNSGETITTKSGVATLDLYMPVAAGSVSATWTLAGSATAPVGAIDKSIGGTTITVTTAVVNPGVDAATDAANEATDAANAATDAALAAADAADAATAAAQDASDAVAALSASVSKLISSLRAQITSLTNLVIKIQKKVRA
jgi:trimeric autotransporter adhesin